MTPDGLTKREYAMLWNVYAAEINGALGNSLGIFQTKSLLIESLRDKGMVRGRTLMLGGRFQTHVSGWELTEYGRLVYCMSCDEPSVPMRNSADG